MFILQSFNPKNNFKEWAKFKIEIPLAIRAKIDYQTDERLHERKQLFSSRSYPWSNKAIIGSNSFKIVQKLSPKNNLLTLYHVWERNL